MYVNIQLTITFRAVSSRQRNWSDIGSCLASRRKERFRIILWYCSISCSRVDLTCSIISTQWQSRFQSRYQLGELLFNSRSPRSLEGQLSLSEDRRPDCKVALNLASLWHGNNVTFYRYHYYYLFDGSKEFNQLSNSHLRSWTHGNCF